MPGALRESLERAFGLRIGSLLPVSGGDIARSFRITAAEGDYFAKVLEGPQAYPMVRAEAEGLLALERSGNLQTPEVCGIAEIPGGASLLLEYLPAGPGTESAFESLGRGLAGMHSKETPFFGWEADNYIGSLPQSNTREASWAEFFARQRLLPQYRMALQAGRLDAPEVPSEDRLIACLEGMAPGVRPVLLHGDLWSGNYLITEGGEPYLIDPAVYCGHGEADLAMTRLFGGFPEPFYRAYHEVLPPEPGFGDRVELYQLYYLLVHLNLFGSSYRSPVTRIGKRYFGP